MCINFTVLIHPRSLQVSLHSMVAKAKCYALLAGGRLGTKRFRSCSHIHFSTILWYILVLGAFFSALHSGRSKLEILIRAPGPCLSRQCFDHIQNGYIDPPPRRRIGIIQVDSYPKFSHQTFNINQRANTLGRYIISPIIMNRGSYCSQMRFAKLCLRGGPRLHFL